MESTSKCVPCRLRVFKGKRRIQLGHVITEAETRERSKLERSEAVDFETGGWGNKPRDARDPQKLK